MLQRMNVFGVENRDTLTHKATGVSIWCVCQQYIFLNNLDISYWVWVQYGLGNTWIDNLAFHSILQNSWRNLISVGQSMHAHISFGLMIKMVLKMENGKLPEPDYIWWNNWCQAVLARFLISCIQVLTTIYLSYFCKWFYCVMKSVWMMFLTYLFLLWGVFRVLLCLKRALRIANAAQQMANVTRGSSGPVTLFVEILNKSVTLNLPVVF